MLKRSWYFSDYNGGYQETNQAGSQHDILNHRSASEDKDRTGFPSGPRPRQRSPACPGRSGLYVPPPRTLSSTHTRQSRVSSHLACKAGFSSRYFSKFGEKQVSHSGFTISLSKVTMSNIKTPIFFIEHLQKVIGNMSFSS